MIIVKIHYGLGNQLFQFALARRLAHDKGIDFKLDISFFETVNAKDKHPRVYQLSQFNISENHASAAEIAPFTKSSFLQRRWQNLAHIVIPYYRRKLVREARRDFDENILNVKNNCYLFGYWQDERYFASIKNLLKKELTYKHPAKDRNAATLQHISETESICLHIRRGDYLTDQFAVNSLGSCDITYYRSAVQYIGNNVSNPVFYIFSDDHAWVKDHFKIDYPAIHVDNNSEVQAFEDLRLMNACKYHILSNSSFSWWGAWLADSKLVIAPDRWRKEGPEMYLPEGWIKI